MNIYFKTIVILLMTNREFFSFQCVPFWPVSCPSKDLAIKVGDSEEISPCFQFEPDVTVLLRMNGKVRHSDARETFQLGKIIHGVGGAGYVFIQRLLEMII